MSGLADEMQIVPNEPFIAQLYALCQEDGDSIAIYDYGTKEKVTRWKFLSDILTLSDYILNALPEHHRQSIADPDTDTFICLIMHSQYEQLLAFMAMYVLGAVAVLFSPGIMPAEAEYFMTLSGAVALVASPECSDCMNHISTANDISRIMLSPKSRAQFDLTHSNTRLDDKAPISPEKGLALFLTSGTTGPPKGVLHSRKSILAAASALPAMWSLSSKDVALLVHSFLWIAGIAFYCGTLMGGASAELCELQMSPRQFWERMQVGGISAFVCTPPFYSKLRGFLENELIGENTESSERFLKNIRECRILGTGSGYLADDLSQYWKDLRLGRPLISMYGSTEVGVPLSCTSHEATSLAPFCVGRIRPGTEINLRDGEEGELYVKTESLFKKYIKSATEPETNAFDENGYYKTGDMARLEGDNLFILGRASLDVIRSNSWMVFAPPIESILLTVPRIETAVVIGIPDDINGQEQIAALVSLRDTDKKPIMNGSAHPGARILQSLHHYLLKEKELPLFWLPTVLRVLKSEESVPVNTRGKVDKKKVRDQFFNMNLKVMKEHDAFETIQIGDIAEHNESDIPWQYWAWDR